MTHRSRRTLALGLTALAVGAAALALPSTAGSSPLADPVGFRPQLVTVDTPTRADKEALQRLGLDLTEHAGHDYVEVVLHTGQELTRLNAAGLTHQVRIPDLLAREAEVNRINAAYDAATTRSRLPSGRTAYRSLADYNADLTRLATSRPRIAKPLTLKHPSLDGRPVRGIEIGSDVRQPASGRPTFVLMGLHHAREWPSGELAMEFATDLVRNYGRKPRITSLLDRARVIVVPVVNPDGFHLSHTDGMKVDLRALNEHDPLGGTTSVLATPGNAYKRKNCRVVDGQDTPDGSCALAASSPGGFGIGTDLNRNYGGFWGGPGAAGGSPEAGADPTYRGAAAFSEPETRNIQDLVRRRHVTMLISNHTFSNLVLRPNGVKPSTIGHDGLPVGDAPDEAALKALGARMARQNGYANIHGWELYDTTGTTEDWSYNATGGFGYTFEIGAHEFHPPYPEVVDEYLGHGAYAGRGNREAYLIALEHAAAAWKHGLVTGKAPRGAVIRLKKNFQSPTWAGSFADFVNTSIRVGSTGRFRWVVNPSTRPVVMSRTYEQIAATPYLTKSFTGTVTPTAPADHEFVVPAAADVWRTKLDWTTPDDLDLEVYRKNGDGTLTKVGSSGNLPGEKESVEVYDVAAGTYVIRVVNYASVSPDYTVTTALHDSVTRRTAGKRESYTLTCEKRGKVLERRTVYVARGQQLSLDLRTCRRNW